MKIIGGSINFLWFYMTIIWNHWSHLAWADFVLIDIQFYFWVDWIPLVNVYFILFLSCNYCLLYVSRVFISQRLIAFQAITHVYPHTYVLFGEWIGGVLLIPYRKTLANLSHPMHLEHSGTGVAWRSVRSLGGFTMAPRPSIVVSPGIIHWEFTTWEKAGKGWESINFGDYWIFFADVGES